MKSLGLHLGVKHISVVPFAFQTCSENFGGGWGQSKLSSLVSKSPEAVSVDLHIPHMLWRYYWLTFKFQSLPIPPPSSLHLKELS